MTDQATWTTPTDIEIKELFLGGTANLPATVTSETVQVGDEVKTNMGRFVCVGRKIDGTPLLEYIKGGTVVEWGDRETRELLSRPTAQPSERMRWNDPRLHVEGAGQWIAVSSMWGITAMDDWPAWFNEDDDEIGHEVRIFRIVEASK
jgi:hypothetical protein